MRGSHKLISNFLLYLATRLCTIPPTYSKRWGQIAVNKLSPIPTCKELPLSLHTLLSNILQYIQPKRSTISVPFLSNLVFHLLIPFFSRNDTYLFLEYMFHTNACFMQVSSEGVSRICSPNEKKMIIMAAKQHKMGTMVFSPSL